MAETTCPVCEGFDDTCPACHPATRPAPPADDDRPDVVDRLRGRAHVPGTASPSLLDCHEGAAEIERLRGVLHRLAGKEPTFEERGQTGPYRVCALCRGTDLLRKPDDVDHADDCAWRLAVDADRHPESDAT